MKKLLVLLLASAALLACEKDDSIKLHDDYYYANGVKYPLTTMDTKYYMIFKTADKQTVIDALNEYGVDGFRIGEYYGPDTEDEIPELADCSNMIVESGIQLSYEMIPKLVYLAHYYLDRGNNERGITNMFSVYPAREQDFSSLNKLATQYGFLMLGRGVVMSDTYYFACTKQTKGNALEMANLVYESYRQGTFEYVIPDFLIDTYPATFKNFSHEKAPDVTPRLGGAAGGVRKRYRSQSY